MIDLLTFYGISLLEWSGLLSFPLILLGYNYWKYFKKLVIIAVLISLYSLLLWQTPLNLVLIMGSQMLVLTLLQKHLYQASYLEATVFTSIGYGFYSLIYLLIIETISTLWSFTYIDLLFQEIKYLQQGVTAFIVIALCMLLYKYDYHLIELRNHIKAPQLDRQTQKIIMFNSALTFLFICLTAFTMVTDEINSRYSFVLASIVILFIILSSYVILHTQFQRKRLLEAKKFYFDQEQQVATIVERLKEQYHNHFQVLLKLSQRESTHLIQDYIEKHHLHLDQKKNAVVQLPKLEVIDELLYAFLVNKRKLADLLGINLIVTIDHQAEVPVSFRQIRHLSSIVDELLFLHYQGHAQNHETKELHFHIQTLDDGIHFHIDSNLIVSEEQSTGLKLIDVLFQMEKETAEIETNLHPVQLSIYCPLY